MPTLSYLPCTYLLCSFATLLSTCLPGIVQCHGCKRHMRMRSSCDIFEAAAHVTVVYTVCRHTIGCIRSTSLLRSSAGRWLL